MDAADSWTVHLSSASRRFQSVLQSRSDIFMGFEEFDGDDSLKEEIPCPFCSEYFDIFGLCCHIDEEHPIDAKNGVCPVCSVRIGSDMVAHITLHHGNIFKIQRRRKLRKGGSHSIFSLSRKDIGEGNLQALPLLGGSSRVISSNAAPDPLLSSFILPLLNDIDSSQHHFSADKILTKKSSDETVSKRNMMRSPSMIKEREEKAKRCDFVQGMLFSTILDDKI